MNSSPQSIVITIAALVLVLVLAWLVIRALSAMTVSKSRGGRLEVLDSVALGTRERLVLVRCDDRQFLIGVTTTSINKIEQLENPGNSPDIDPKRN